MTDRASMDDRFIASLLKWKNGSKPEPKAPAPVQPVPEPKAIKESSEKPEKKPRVRKPKPVVETPEHAKLREVTKVRIASEAQKEVAPVEVTPTAPVETLPKSEATVAKKKRTITPEHLAKMRAGLLKKLSEKKD